MDGYLSGIDSIYFINLCLILNIRRFDKNKKEIDHSHE